MKNLISKLTVFSFLALVLACGASSQAMAGETVVTTSGKARVELKGKPVANTEALFCLEATFATGRNTSTRDQSCAKVKTDQNGEFRFSVQNVSDRTETSEPVLAAKVTAEGYVLSGTPESKSFDCIEKPNAYRLLDELNRSGDRSCVQAVKDLSLTLAE